MARKNETTETKTTKRTMSEEAKKKIAEAVSGLSKLTPEQEQMVKKVYADNNKEKIATCEKLIARRVLFKLTGLDKYAPRMKSSANEKRKTLDEILFS